MLGLVKCIRSSIKLLTECQVDKMTWRHLLYMDAQFLKTWKFSSLAAAFHPTHEKLLHRSL